MFSLAAYIMKSGVAVMVDNQLPNLVNLNEDPQLSELLLYVIKTGQTKVGRKRSTASHDIQLSGALIADNHWFNHPIEVKKNKKGSGATEVKDFEFAKQELLRVQEAKLQEELMAARRAAQEKMEEELERARREAEMELNQQKSGYEDKLADLEKTLKEQTLEVQKAEQSRQEAHSLIADLRKQKMMLEQEVLAGRKRQQLEAEAAKKVNTEFVSNKSRILELLEMERSKVKQRLDEVRQRRAEMISPSKRRRTATEGSTGGGMRRDLYKVALLLREANKISQYLKKNLVFSREDIEDESEDGGDAGTTQTVIKVTNTHHRIFTHWTVSKLEEKVMQMRDLYQVEVDLSLRDLDVSTATNSDDGGGRNGQYYHQSYRRLQALIGQVSSLAETPLLLLQIAGPGKAKISDASIDVRN
nr:hypothetical protein BaRGS_011558 [Batillaria attramentaria]